ncbi:MAG: DUF3786 domain-containing protein [Coriobacteriia bacterium]|nr:DUF3786 domain-containing protein [Coriobacteriia bacterium]
MGADGLQAARARAERVDPFEASAAAGIPYEGSGEAGRFEVPFLGETVCLTYPGFDLAQGSSWVPDHVLALIVYHLAVSDGTPPSGREVSFAELPDGTFYVQAFRGYTSSVIVRRFADAPEKLDAAVRALGGEALEAASDSAWRIPALPRVPVTLLWWDADDEFESRAELLFDESAHHHLPTDGCAILGSWLTARLGR